MTATTKAIMLVTVVLVLVVVILSIALLALAAHRNSSPTDTTIPDGVPAAPAYIPSGTPSPYELYQECVKVGFAPYRCENTYLR